MRTTRLFSFSDTFLASCGDVDHTQLIDLLPVEISAAQRQITPGSFSLTAAYMNAHKPDGYDRSCIDLLHRNFEMGPPTGDTAALACSLPEYTEETLEFAFESGTWRPVAATQDLLDYLAVDDQWYRSIDVRPTTSPRADRTPH